MRGATPPPIQKRKSSLLLRISKLKRTHSTESNSPVEQELSPVSMRCNSARVQLINSQENLTVGFLRGMDVNSKMNLQNKIEEKQSKSDRVLKTPLIATEIFQLIQNFSEFPAKMILALVNRNYGNCTEVCEFLIARAWKPICSNIQFTNATDGHYTTNYYYGEAPNEDNLKKIFANAKVGSFVTFYRYICSEKTDDNFHYILCYKNSFGTLTEKPMRVMVVPNVLRLMLGLTTPVKKRDNTLQTNLIPGLSSLLKNHL